MLFARKSVSVSLYFMCFSPIHISRYSNGFYAYDVPCGHCPQCRQTRINDITFRIWYEFNKINHDYFLSTGIKESRAIFGTLTYNDVNLPSVLCNKIFDPVFDDSGFLLNPPSLPFCVSCFDKKSVQSFFKSLNDNFKYKIGLKRGIQRLSNGCITSEWKDFLINYRSVTNCKRPFKYFVVCERGKNNTKRPHYHFILLIEDNSISVSEVKKWIREQWNFGFSYNLSLGGNRKDLDCIKYVCKYIHKDSDDILNSSDIMFESLDIEKNSRPFSLSSNFLGQCFLDTLSSTSLEYLCKSGVTIGGKNPINIPLPRYYVKKLSYFHRISSEDEWCKTSSGNLRVLPLLSPFYRGFTTTCPFSDDPFNYGVVNSRKHIMYDDILTGSRSFIFADYESLPDYLSRKRIFSNRSKFGLKLQDYFLSKKAKRFCDYLDLLKSGNLDVSLPEFIALNSITPRKFSLFIRKGLYRFRDNSRSHIFKMFNQLYFLYDSINKYISSSSKQNYTLHQFGYRSKLPDVMSNKPEFFNLVNYNL